MGAEGGSEVREGSATCVTWTRGMAFQNFPRWALKCVRRSPPDSAVAYLEVAVAGGLGGHLWAGEEQGTRGHACRSALSICLVLALAASHSLPQPRSFDEVELRIIGKRPFARQWAGLVGPTQQGPRHLGACTHDPRPQGKLPVLTWLSKLASDLW